MKTKTSTWYECKIRYEKMMGDGTLKKVTEAYTVEALSFTEAEANIIKEMSAYISGAFEVRDIKKAAYSEVFFSDSPCIDAKWVPGQKTTPCRFVIGQISGRHPVNGRF